MINAKILFIVEEIGNIEVSAAIVNWNLCQLIGEQNTLNSDILTLDSIEPSLVKSWTYGTVFTHPKNNLLNYQRFIKKIYKVSGLIQTILGSDFQHFNRISNIKSFLLANASKYDTVVYLSGGHGFTPHFSLLNNSYLKHAKKIGVYHDPYPMSSYPEGYKSGNWYFDYFKRRNLQKTFNKLDTIIFPSKKLYEWYKRDYDISDKKTKIIPHAINFDFKKHELKKNTSDSVQITHTGTLLAPRNPYTFLKVFKKINKQRASLSFYGSIHQTVSKKILNFNKVEHIQIHDNRIPYDTALQKLIDSDFLLLIESDVYHNPFLPTKFVDYVNIGRPIIALTSENSEVSRLLGNEYPFISELNNENKLYDILNSDIYDKTKIAQALTVLDNLKLYFSKGNIVKSYQEIIQKKVEGRN